MKIRLWQFWLHFCFFTSKRSQYTKTQSCNSGASGKKVRSHSGRSGALRNYRKATSPAASCATAQRGEGGTHPLLALRAQAAMSTRVAKHPGQCWNCHQCHFKKHSWKRYWPFAWTHNEKSVGPAPLAPGTTLHLLPWKAYNHFPWKNERLCQFACTLLQLKTIRCFQSVALQ